MSVKMEQTWMAYALLSLLMIVVVVVVVVIIMMTNLWSDIVAIY
jgi:heme/copper-type cytochrome/quinol oxidase subunit 4